jgi:hypothetical protein
MLFLRQMTRETTVELIYACCEVIRLLATSPQEAISSEFFIPNAYPDHRLIVRSGR